MPAPGIAKTSKFMLSTATVMVGPVADLHKLNSIEHSIGLVKNFQMTADPQYIELTQGISNDVVMSVKYAEGIKAAMEVYEFSLRNIAYAAGLDGSGVEYDAISDIHPLSATATTTTVKVADDLSSDLSAGDYIFIQKGTEDVVHIAKVTTVVFATGETTVTLATGYEIPATLTFGVGDRMGKVKRIDIGGRTTQPEVAVKVVGLLPKDGSPFTIMFPKVKITKGLAAAFQSDNFSNMPFEFTPYAGIPGDPFYSDYGAASAILLPR